MFLNLYLIDYQLFNSIKFTLYYRIYSDKTQMSKKSLTFPTLASKLQNKTISLKNQSFNNHIPIALRVFKVNYFVIN
jgi:hypothetical protein